MQAPVLDLRQRPLRDLRISVTDRCNFRCSYCMPKEIFGSAFRFLPREDLLSFEEITRLVEVLVGIGVRKVRLTGGEPLLRRGLHQLVQMLRGISELTDIALTTNGSLLARQAAALRDAGLDRITVSLDSLDDEIFAAMNDVDFPVARVLEGIDTAAGAGFSPVKINVVVKRGVNDGGLVQMADRFRDERYVLRFIEYMDVGTTNGWKLRDVVPASEMLDVLSRHFRLMPLEPQHAGEVARRFRNLEGGGEIGLITSVTRPFCADCCRARLSSEGVLYTCLFASTGQNLRDLLRSDASDAQVKAVVSGIWTQRDDRYSELRAVQKEPVGHRVEMSRIGG